MGHFSQRRERRDLNTEHADQERESYTLPEAAERDRNVPADWCNVYLLFNLEAAVMEGHTVLALAPRLDGPMETYSFYRQGNALRAPGLMACLREPETLAQLEQASGWLVHGQPGNWWNEHMNAALALAVPPQRFAPIQEYARNAKAAPPEYDLVSFNCLTFAVEALKAGGVQLTTHSGRDLHTIIPRDAFEDVEGAVGAQTYGRWKYWFPNTVAPDNGLKTIPDLPNR